MAFLIKVWLGQAQSITIFLKSHHTLLAGGKWHTLSLIEQMANIGSEVSRAKEWQEKNEKYFENAITRAFELLDLTIQDARWRTRLKELTRAREILADATLGGKEYKSSLEDLERYFYHFALAARIHK
ncbi:MAG: hypothetical protein G01um101433_185 [Parcubacteria group bacterium Gr01-1014_33]|nr:MAG: hypothetical protein G01um101433_185 [Parcubacteria group bacterium Gr01-1014_33]